jgi:drug/metabolite transporter (DMT)-like permease
MNTTSPSSSTSLRAGWWFAILGAVAFSGKAIIVKIAYRYGVDAVTLLTYRMLFALPLFLTLAWWAGRGRPALSGRDWGSIALLGFCGYYLASYLDFVGLQYISASLERLILYLNPSLVLAWSVLVLKKPLLPWQWRGLLISYAGVLLVFGHELQLTGTDVAWGAFMVFASTVSYAVYLIRCGDEVKRIGALRLTGWATSAASGFCFAQFVWLRPLEALVVPAQVLGLSVINAVFCTFVPVLLVMLAIERLGAAAVSQVSMVGPMATILLSVVILGEPFTIWTALGTGLVLIGVWLAAKR